MTLFIVSLNKLVQNISGVELKLGAEHKVRLTHKHIIIWHIL